MSGRQSPRFLARLLGLLLALPLVGCSPSTASPSPASSPGQSPASIAPSSPGPTAAPSTGVPTGRVIYLGDIVTMGEPARVEAIAINGGLVEAVGDRETVLALADDATRVVELGDNVAYPGFIDAHAHWIGDRGVMGVDDAGAAIDAALARGWTSISEEWVDEDRLRELEALDAAGALRTRVDAYLALNLPAPSGEHLGDWYADLEPGSRSDRFTVKGVKITLDNGWGTQFWWTAEDLAAAVARADAAGWQVATHTVSTAAHEMVISAYEAALDGGPNALHHRIDHAIQVTDAHLARMVAADLVAVVHLDGGAADWVLEADYLGNLGADTAPLARWRDFVDAGLHVAATTDAPWIFPDFELVEGIGRPVDQVAGGMDGRGRANPDTPAWVLDQLLTADQALRAITIDAAYALGDEARRGHLAPGTYADITILSGNLTDATPDEIRALKVVATVVGGVVEHCTDESICGGR